MKIRPKVPVCTDCDHVFEYRGRNPGQLGGVVVQFGEAYCTKKKKPRLLKRWHNMLRVPDWCFIPSRSQKKGRLVSSS